MEILHNFIDGRMAEAASGKWLDVHEPASGKVYARMPDSDSTEVEQAVIAAEKAFPEWNALGREGRSQVLLKVVDLIEYDLGAFARAESKDTGKPIALARKVDIPRAVSNFRFFATAILHF